MNISVIVPVKNDQRIQRCLEALTRQKFDGEYEIIVVENDITRPLKDAIEQFPVKYLCEPHGGSYNARNSGISLAQYNILAFTDSDCIVDENWLQSLAFGFSSEKCGGVCGRNVNLPEEGNLVVMSQRNIASDGGPQYLPQIFHAPFAPTCNVAYRRSVINRLNGFDEEFKSGGDVDIAWRMNILGYTLVYAPDAIVHFGCRNTLSGYFRQFYNYGMGHTLLFKKYKRITGRKLILNAWSRKLIFHSIANLFWRFITLQNKEVIMPYMLELLEGLGLLTGGIVGSFKNHVIYTT